MSSKQRSPQTATQDSSQVSPREVDSAQAESNEVVDTFEDLNASSSTRPMPAVNVASIAAAAAAASTPPDAASNPPAASTPAASTPAASIPSEAVASASDAAASVPEASVDASADDAAASTADATAASAPESDAAPAIVEPAAEEPAAVEADPLRVVAMSEPEPAVAAAAEDLNATVVLARRVPHPEASEQAYTTTELPAVEPAEPEAEVEWEVADQPTIQFTPPIVTPRPAFLETGEQPLWPPRPTPQPSTPVRPHSTPTPTSVPPTTPRTLVTPQPGRPMPIPRPPQRPGTPPERLASPTGKRPLGDTSAAYSDPRMRRYVELRMQRGAHEQGKRGPTDNMPVTQMVRQWWNDLLPGLQTALDHQHEARSSGVYPIPAHEPTVSMRLGDAFGRLTAAVRDITGRAQSAAMPALSKLHERAEHAAQTIVDHLEGTPARQQAPLLGPGRLAVFFRQGVTVGQAQRLLLIHEARPMRLIPRRHGFLAKVAPGQETEVAGKLNQHPYVRDVVFLEYDENGQPLEPR